MAFELFNSYEYKGVVYRQEECSIWMMHDAYRYVFAFAKGMRLGVSIGNIDRNILTKYFSRYHEELLRIIKNPMTSSYGAATEECAITHCKSGIWDCMLSTG